MTIKQNEQKDNPWSDSKWTEFEEAYITRDTVQCVQNLPSVLADDIILQNILKPTNQNQNLEQYPNVLPLKVNFSGHETKEINGKKISTQNAPNGKQVQYDPDKGFVSSCWSNFELDPQNESTLSDSKGIFIKHMTSTVINPKQLRKGEIMPNSVIDIKSFTTTSQNLASNAWSNVLLYKPKEQIFKFDFEKKKLVPQIDDNEGQVK